MPRRLKAPTADGAVLAEPAFDAVPRLVEANRRLLDRSDVRISGMPLNEFRQAARREILACVPGQPAPANGPLIIAGHQPELAHPGVWVKNFALNGLARKLGGIPLNLIVDNDTIKHAAVKAPIFSPTDPTAVRPETIPYDRISGKPAYEGYRIEHPELFETFAQRVSQITQNWGYRPLVLNAWQEAATEPTLGEQLSALRRHYECKWGCCNFEIPVSRLAQTDIFAQFAGHILGDLPRFREAYNSAIRRYRETNGIRNANHPAPELAEGEAPFWVRTGKTIRRERATAISDTRLLRPRAVTLTLFARVCLGDFFIHGIGGGKYDEVTDGIICDYFGIEPPAYQVLSATLRLPLPGFPSTDEDVKKAARLVRDLRWNPQRHIPASALNDPNVLRLVADRISLAVSVGEASRLSSGATGGNAVPQNDHQARREWFRQIQGLNEKLRPFVAVQAAEAKAELKRVESESRANEVLRRRDYSWVLFPEALLRTFLQQFLTV
jgi:hypothetical protein